jgi:hypothetical protein
MIANLVGAFPGGVERMAAEAEATSDSPLDVLASPAMPAELAQLFLGAMRLNPIMLAVAQALEAGAKLEPWLAHALLQRWIRSIQDAEHLFALLGGGPHPTLISLGLAQSEVLRGREILLGRARESGGDVYPDKAD